MKTRGGSSKKGIESCKGVAGLKIIGKEVMRRDVRRPTLIINCEEAYADNKLPGIELV